MSNAHFAYPWNEWEEALNYFQEATLDPKKRLMGSATLAQAYFSNRYPTPSEAEWKRQRFVKAMQWLDANIEEFDHSTAGVVGKDGALVGRSTHLALHYMFSEIGDSLLDQDPPLEVVKGVEAQLREGGL